MQRKILISLGLLSLAMTQTPALADTSSGQEIRDYLKTAPAQILRENRDAIACRLPELNTAWLQSAAPRSGQTASAQLAQSCPGPHA